MDSNSLKLSLYLLYVAIGSVFTIWVGRTLHKNGRIFLVDTFEREDLADSVNHLLIVGFYLINFGYLVMTLRSGSSPQSSVEVVEALSTSVGRVILVLGGMHFFNLYVFSRMRKNAQLRSAPPPFSPSESVRRAGA